MRRRLIIAVALILVVGYAPWWLSVLLTLLFIWRFNSGFELLLPAILADLVYGSPVAPLFGFAFPATLLTALAVISGRVLTQRFFLQT